MPFGEVIYSNDGTKYKKGEPGAYGVVEVKKMLERRARELGISLPVGFDPYTLTYGASAEKLCADIQTRLGLKADGACGPTTMRAGYKPDLKRICTKIQQDFEQVCKLISLESSFNPSAFAPGPTHLSRYPNGTWDRGIAQNNSISGISDAEAFNVLEAFETAASRLQDAIEHYDGELDVAIASYNVGPTGASYYKAGRNYWNLYQKQSC